MIPMWCDFAPSILAFLDSYFDLEFWSHSVRRLRVSLEMINFVVVSGEFHSPLQTALLPTCTACPSPTRLYCPKTTSTNAGAPLIQGFSTKVYPNFVWQKEGCVSVGSSGV